MPGDTIRGVFATADRAQAETCYARARPSSRLHPSASAGPYVTAPQSQHHVRCRPHEQAMLPTSIRPGRNRCPRGKRCGGRLALVDAAHHH
jgi:hypothetical protein